MQTLYQTYYLSGKGSASSNWSLSAEQLEIIMIVAFGSFCSSDDTQPHGSNYFLLPHTLNFTKV
jgi:hypothetical protein